MWSSTAARWSIRTKEFSCRPIAAGSGWCFRIRISFRIWASAKICSSGAAFAPRAARAISFDAVVETLGIGQLLGRTPRQTFRRRAPAHRHRPCVAVWSAALLMDEPLAALDRARRLEILPLIERLRDEFKIPMSMFRTSRRSLAAGEPGGRSGAGTCGCDR